MTIHSYKDLIVWQKAIDLVSEVYNLVGSFPQSEIYGLISQLKRAATSIPSNIAEGRRRATRKDFKHFLVMAYGSGAELETQIEIAKRLGFGNAEKYRKVDTLLDEVMKMLNKITHELKSV